MKNIFSSTLCFFCSAICVFVVHSANLSAISEENVNSYFDYALSQKNHTEALLELYNSQGYHIDYDRTFMSEARMHFYIGKIQGKIEAYSDMVDYIIDNRSLSNTNSR